MSIQTSDQRQPPPNYTSLRASVDPAATRHHEQGHTQPQPVDTAYLTAETRKLESLKEALFEAFLAAPAAGIPTALVDLAATYTSALRLQLTLMGYTANPHRSYRSPAPQMTRAKLP
jgi:hypothetical protein